MRAVRNKHFLKSHIRVHIYWKHLNMSSTILYRKIMNALLMDFSEFRIIFFFFCSHSTPGIIVWLSLECELWMVGQLRYVRAQVACFRFCANWSFSTLFRTLILRCIVFFPGEFMFLLLNREKKGKIKSFFSTTDELTQRTCVQANTCELYNTVSSHSLFWINVNRNRKLRRALPAGNIIIYRIQFACISWAWACCFQ